jgi:ABC-type bacteriocin/lantibiotic exporter with double-glycine peptidase domain
MHTLAALILISDEATSSVDTEAERSNQRALAHVLTGRITFVIAHRLTTTRNATGILAIETRARHTHGADGAARALTQSSTGSRAGKSQRNPCRTQR